MMLVQECLKKIEAHPELNAFITVLKDQHAAPGPLHGIPIGIKDFYDTAGIRTTAAFKPFANRVPAKDAAAVASMPP
jgi:aspartyl-tRNA(Asn)/glutamyl-tRNA(Gln) amidotransferase subunit A